MATPLSKESSPRRFAPLKESSNRVKDGLPRLKGIVFDVDGTLWSVFWISILDDFAILYL